MAADLDTDPQTDDNEDDVSNSVSTSDEELEQYGVWVKIGPEDVDDGPLDEGFGLDNLSPDELDGEAMLTAEEEQLLGNLEEEPADELGNLSDMSLDEFTEDGDVDTPDESAFDESEADELGNLAEIKLDDDLPEMLLDPDLVELDLELIDLDIPDAAEADLSDIEDANDVLPGASEELNDIELDDLDQSAQEEDLLELEVEDDAADYSADLGLDSLDASLEVGMEPPSVEEYSLDSLADPAAEPMDDLASL